MAPTKGTKRAATVAEPKSAKVSKVDPDLAAIFDIVAKAPEVSDSCKAMLSAAIPCSFGGFSDERHEHCVMFVNMIGELVEETRSKMQRDIDEEAAAVAGAESSKENLQTAIAGAEAKLASVEGDKEDKQTALAGAKKVVHEKKDAVAEAQVVQTNAETTLQKEKKEKDTYELAFEEHYKPLRDQVIEAGEVQKHCDHILPLITQLRLDDSLLTSFPESCAKAPEARGAFDQLVMTQVGKDISDHVASLIEKLKATEAEVGHNALAFSSAEQALADAQKAEQEASNELSGAIAATEEASVAVATTKEAMTKFMHEFVSITKVRDAKVQALDHFEKVNVASFMKLKDRVKDVSVQEDVPEVPAKEVPVEAVPKQVGIAGA